MTHKTYEIGRRRHKSWRRVIVGILAVLFLAGGLYSNKQFQEATKPVVRNSAESSHTTVVLNARTQHFDQPVFGFDAPADWKHMKHDTAPYNLYSYRSTLVDADNRYLDIYVDKLPQSLAVNKAVAVYAQGNNLTHGVVSDNCTTFTSVGPTGIHSDKPLSILSKWDGVEFLCDNDNVTHNVIGTSAPGSINKVTLTSLASGLHPFFFVYTDNNATPDYTIFYRMLESFVVK